MIRLLAIRHAPVTVERVFYGQSDVPTTLTGAEAVAQIEPIVAEFGPAVIWSSDAARCRVPAALLSKRLIARLCIDERIREFSYGEWEGRAWDDVPRSDVEEWMADWQMRSPPGGESGAAFSARVAAWWQDLEPGNHFLMAHAGVVYCLDVIAGGRAWEQTLEQRLDFLEARQFARTVPRAPEAPSTPL